MNIISITVAVNYHGELAVALPSIVAACDESYVVTDPKDKRTLEITYDSGALPIHYDGFKRKGAAFNKSGAVMYGQRYAHLRFDPWWVLLVDADIVLPPETRETIEREAVDGQALYGIKRLDYYTPESYARGEHDAEYRHLHAGYFQLYRRRDILYRPWSRDASHCDFAFRKRFEKLGLLSGHVKHLGYKAQNWSGRVTPEWR